MHVRKVASAYQVNCPMHGGNGGMLVTPDTPHGQNLVCRAHPFLHSIFLWVVSTEAVAQWCITRKSGMYVVTVL